MAVPSLATVEETKHALRIDDDDLISNASLEALIKAASEEVVAYLKTTKIEDDSTSPPTIVMDLEAESPIIPARVRQATIMLVGFLYKSPDSNQNNEWTHGYLPQPVQSLLHQLRDPAIA